MLSQTTKLNQTSLIIHAFPNKWKGKNTKTNKTENMKTNQWNHEDKTWEAYRCFAMTGEQRRELRRGVATPGEKWERERELNDSETKEWIYTPKESKNLA